ncbi:MAG: hypothetical protein WD208_01900 [Dehalococcoidia bacterium]
MEWLKNNALLLSVFVNILMLAVWVFYATLLYRDYRRRQRPRLIIHQSRGYSTNSICLLINMSQQHLNVECVMAVVHDSEKSYKRIVTSYDDISLESTPHEAEARLRQGPLSPGAFIPLGTFDDLLTDPQEGIPGTPLPADDVHTIEIRAVAAFGSEDKPVGARREFSVNTTGDSLQVRPAKHYTKQMSSRSERREVMEWLEECLRLA